MYNFSILIITVFFLASCSSSPKKKIAYFNQATINALVAAGQFEKAVQAFNTGTEVYGPKSKLLYLLDRAYTLHLAKGYKESIRYFAFAENKIDALYTKSVTNIASTWLINDTNAVYRGEEFEHSLINVFQALNYVSVGQTLEALVEARSLDRKLNLLKQIFPKEGENIYREDAFGRFFAGILYEATHDRQDLNDAVISYKKALQAYESKFYQEAHRPPHVLVENLLASLEELGFEEYAPLRQKFSGIKFASIAEKKDAAEVYLIHYNGLCAIKHPVQIPIPLPDGYVTQVAFPEYHQRFFEVKNSKFIAVGDDFQKFVASTELGVDLEAAAKKSLLAKRNWLIAKGVIRPLGKYALEQNIEERAKERHGKAAGYAVKGISNIYNLFSEQADLRSWQTLPAQIRIARLILKPGTYDLKVLFLGSGKEVLQEEPLPSVTLQAGDKKFFIVRSVK